MVEQPEPARAGRAPEVWGKVPPRNHHFTGRDELLRDLRRHISSNRNSDVTAVVPHALHGFGGVGKTQVAIEFAHRFRNDYDLVWWVPADQRFLVKASLAQLAPHLGLTAAANSGSEDAAAAVLEALRKGQPYGHWLLIFDNADQPEDIMDSLPHGPGHVLITSRNHRWQGVVNTVAVDVFSRDESTEFLAKRAFVNKSDADRLAEELGDLPLALEQAGALQAETGISVDEYLRLLAEQTTELLSESKPSEYPLSMTAAWALSVKQLKAKLPEAVNVLRCCAFFGPEPIPRDVFRRAGEHARDPELRAILSDPILLSRAIRELGRFALAHIDSTSRTVQVHRLVQALLREELEPEEQARYRHEVHLLLAGASPLAPNDTGNWARYAELIAHVRPSKLADCSQREVRETAIRMVEYLYRSGNYGSAKSFIESFVTAWTRESGPDDEFVLIAERYLGSVVRELGSYRDAYQIDHSTLQKMTEALGDDHSETLILSSGLAADLRAAGDFKGARELDEDLRRRHDKVFGPGAPETLRIMNNLALDYGLNSEYVKAKDLHQETYQLQCNARSGVSRTDVLLSYNGLARAVRLCGEFAAACDIGEDAYAYGMAEVGGDHPFTLRSDKDLSIAMRRAGRLEDALGKARAVHAQLQRLMGDDHPDTAAAAVNLSNALRANRMIEESLEVAKEVVSRYTKIYGVDHPYTQGCASNLAVLQRLSGDPALARRTNEVAVKTLRERLGPDHHYALTCAVNLASDHAALGELDKAIALGEDTLIRLRNLLGADYPLVLACLTNLALDLAADGRTEASGELLQQAHTGYTRTIGLEHPDAQVALIERVRMDCDFDPPPI